jgi:uncharacterized protein (DUF2336 family)
MIESKSFLTELEDAVSHGSAESCLRALWHATDVLIAGRYSEDQIWTFGEVIGRLANEIEQASRIKLARKLAPSNNAPFDVIRKLAFDDSIDVAGPVLRQSERIDGQSLIANAKTKSQQHLLAIANRKHISYEVSDVLVKRGDKEVIRSVAANSGANLSNFGFLHLLNRSDDDSIVAENVGSRKDIPRHIFQQLISKASDEVRAKLERERPDLASQVRATVTDITGAFQAKFGPATKNYFTAKRAVTKLQEYGQLDEDKLFEFAHSLKLEETTVALSLLCALPIDVVERALVDKNREVILVLARALDLSWPTTMALLFLGAANYRIIASDLDTMKREYYRLNVNTSRQVLKAYESRKGTSSDDSCLSRLPQLHNR